LNITAPTFLVDSEYMVLIKGPQISIIILIVHVADLKVCIIGVINFNFIYTL